MDIAFFVNAFPLISETFILGQITDLIDRGHRVDIYALRNPGAGPSHAVVESYGLLERTTYIEDQHPARHGALATAALVQRHHGWLHRNAPALARKFIRFRRRKGTLMTLHALIPKLRRNDYDVLHCQYGSLGPNVLLMKQLGVITGKLVTSFRGNDATAYPRRFPRVYDELFEGGELFLPISEQLRARIVELGCDPGKIAVLHDGIDCADFALSERCKRADEPLEIISVARLVEKKGLKYGIEAVAGLITAGRRVRYTIVGDGVLRAELTRLTQALGIDHAVRLVGAKTDREVLALLQDAHVLLAPSVISEQGDQEGIPTVIKEAMAVGLPVVSTRHGGIPELVTDTVTGFLVAERDTQALAARLRDLDEHPGQWAAMARAGRARVEAEFDRTRITDELVRLYRDADPS